MLNSLGTPVLGAVNAATYQRILPAGPVAKVLGLAVALSLASAGSAQAGSYDAIQYFASVGFNHDSNLFRLPDDSPGYGGVRDDTSRSVTAGVAFDQTYGRQQITAQAQASRVNFSHFSVLDYNGTDGRANLNWHLGNHLDGTAGATYAETLAPYTDVSTNDRNLRLEQREYATVNWNFHPSWRARAGWTHSRFHYDLLSQAYNNHTDDNGEAGVDYLVSSGSSIGLQVGKLKRNYDVLRSVNGQQVDADSDQTDLKLKVVWRATQVTTVQFLGGHARRSYSSLNERDSSGFNARLIGSTMIDGKISLNANIWREFSGVESTVFSYAQNTGASLTAGWDLSAKLRATADAKYLQRRFEGLLASRVAEGLRDTTNTYTAGLTYTPLPLISLNASLFREGRTGIALLGSGSYHANGASVTVNLQY
ncbi:hypothetical protein GTP46_27160 [Duganella sp. FT135W]|uniref:Outer membrane beta-barrel protein n=1 Tax=Duganella flavida TaxID=2692175 RepID=A0A6L8KGS8_9BURK|nr:XrtB/PEP-CTERM-associated polysaccharide biosynthesis outer membrane protein EpsL [Duganella flavida]MYM26315.1 hypothetical protein [Duganella flavida]